MAENNHHKPCRNIPWQRTVGLAVQQGSLEMDAYRPSHHLLDDY